ncbi:MAG: HAD family phosphatase [Clostridia bacterium]|nr:HAD family phosphatase [Clostridia bacterium]
MAKYRLLAADMDGTLLDSSSNISGITLQAINDAMAAGVRFAVVSGRSVPSLMRFPFIRELNCPVIAYNGAAIYDPKEDKLLYYEGLENSDALWLLKRANERGITVCAWSRNRYYTNLINERSLDYGRLSGMEPTVFTDCEALAAHGVTKIIWNDSPEKVQQYIKDLDKEKFASLSYCTSNPCFLELMNKKVSKARALEMLCGFYGITLDETAAAGDGENDLSMLKAVGLGVAMANAGDSVKSQCGYITASNDEDGVARLIYDVILKEE